MANSGWTASGRQAVRRRRLAAGQTWRPVGRPPHDDATGRGWPVSTARSARRYSTGVPTDGPRTKDEGLRTKGDGAGTPSYSFGLSSFVLGPVFVLRPWS